MTARRTTGPARTRKAAVFVRDGQRVEWCRQRVLVVDYKIHPATGRTVLTVQAEGGLFDIDYDPLELVTVWA